MRRWIFVAGLLGTLWTVGMGFAATERLIIDPTISLGVIIHLLTLVGTILGTFFWAGRFVERQKQEFLREIQRLHLDMTEKVGALTERITVVESRVSDLWDSWKDGRR